MDNNEDDPNYPPRSFGVNNQQGYGSLNRSKVVTHNAAMYSRTSSQYVGDEENGEDEELGEEVEGINGVRMIGKDNYDDDDDDDDTEDDDDIDDDVDDDDNEDGIGNARRKKRKLKNLISNYEFAPRLPAPAPPTHQAAPSRPSSGGGGRSSGAEWTDRETFALLDAWGDRFLKLGRKSLRSEEWQEVSEKVSQETNIERTDSQCRNRLDTLKKKYKKEKAWLSASGGAVASKWPFYRKVDMLMYSPPQKQSGLSCGIDSGEYVFMNPKVYLNRANGLDEMRDSPGNSESSRDVEEEDSDGLPPRKRSRGENVDSSSFCLLADSIQKFSDIYEKIESNKRKQMVELENMRMDFQRQVETQRRQILERAQAEIAKIRQGTTDDDENDLSAGNISG